MEIRWLGQSAFEVKTAAGTVVCDPYPGLFERGAALDPNTIATFSRQGGKTDWLPESVHVIDRPGEYEMGGLSVRGVATPAGDPASSRAVNTVFLVDAEGLTVCALGLPGVTPDATALQMMGPVDVLLVRTDGAGMPADQRAGTARQIEAKVVAVNGYDSVAGSPNAALARLLKELGVKQVEPQPRFAVSKSSLPPDLKVVVLTPRS